MNFLLRKSNRFFVYALVFSAIAAAYNYVNGESPLEIWYKSLIITSIASLLGFIISAFIGLFTIKKGTKAGESTLLHLFKMSIFEEHMMRLVAIVAIKVVLTQDLMPLEAGAIIAVITLAQMLWFMAIHHRVNIMHMIYPLIWLSLAWYGGLIAAVVSHMSANMINRLLADDE